jgi:hypothetical protein
MAVMIPRMGSIFYLGSHPSPEDSRRNRIFAVGFRWPKWPCCCSWCLFHINRWRLSVVDVSLLFVDTSSKIHCFVVYWYFLMEMFFEYANRFLVQSLYIVLFPDILRYVSRNLVKRWSWQTSYTPVEWHYCCLYDVTLLIITKIPNPIRICSTEGTSTSFTVVLRSPGQP